MMNKIALTTSSFAVHSRGPLELLESNGFTWTANPHGRTLKPNEVRDVLKGCVGVIAGTESYDDETLTSLPDLKVISRCGVGTDAIDMNAIEKRGIKLCVTPDAPVQAVAELVIGLAFNLLREVNAMDRDVRAGKWQKRSGVLLEGKRLGIVGFGRIGRQVAVMARALGMAVNYYDPFLSVLSLDGMRMLSLNDLLAQSDIVSIHVPLTPETRGLIGAAEIKTMSKGSYLIQCSRGGIVDEKALYEALESRHLAGAALDVFETEPYAGHLTRLDNIILLPHVGSNARETRERMEMEAVENFIREWQALKALNISL